MIQHGPSRGRDYETPADLDNGQRDTEEGEDMRSDEVRPHQEVNAVEGDPARKGASGVPRVAFGQGQEDGASPQRIDDRKERAQKEEERLPEFTHRPIGRRSLLAGAPDQIVVRAVTVVSPSGPAGHQLESCHVFY